MKKRRLTISLIIPRYPQMFSTFYTLEIIKETSKAAIEFDVDLLIEAGWKIGSGWGILFADRLGNEAWIKRASREKLPYLILNYYDARAKDNCIGIDNEKASFRVVDYLVKLGHRDIAAITGKLNAQSGRQRLAGFQKAIKTDKIDLDKHYIITGDWTKESGKQAMQKLLLFKKRPTAVFVAGDEMALGAIEATREAGLKIPGDISFVGFDNIYEAGLKEVSLTTVEQPFSDLARLGLKHLIQIIRNKSPQPIKILLDNTKLIERASVREISSG